MSKQALRDADVVARSHADDDAAPLPPPPPPPPPYAREAPPTGAMYELEGSTPAPVYELEAPSIPVAAAPDVRDDGRIDIDVNSSLAKALAVMVPENRASTDLSRLFIFDKQKPWILQLNIVIQVVGSRGDVQPFIALGQELQKFGHRVRLATHDVFDGFVRESGLEFYPIGGDPKELMAYMVKNPGLIPSMDSLRQGDIQRKRKMVADILNGCWKSCIEADAISHKPFVADAIIANPPSFAHIHCAQALGIPVHLMFTMPWSSTRAFPHPLTNVEYSSTDRGVANYISYGIVEWITWQGIGDIINKWRHELNLEPIPITEGPILADVLKVPFTYCWSPALVPKPIDWPPHIDVCGFFFREPPKYMPLADLDQFLKTGPKPVYIGFGSIVIDNPEKMCALILEAVRLCGVRAIISRGWSNLGDSDSTENVFYLGDCPHEWLFQHVSAVVHHGGAGTTACGLLNACPTMIIPFFGDQPFWGNMVAAAGAGPRPIKHKALTSQNLAEAIQFCLTPEAAVAAREISLKMKAESGVRTAVDSFHAHLPLERLQCDLLPSQPAAWLYDRKFHLKLSKAATEILLNSALISRKHIKSYQTNPIIIENRRWDPVTGTSSAMINTTTGLVDAAAGIFWKPYEELRRANQEKDNGEGSSGGGAVTAARMAAASAKSVGKLYGRFLKGTVVDIPFAAAEGFRALPRLYGDEVRDHGPVTDWKSGTVVAAKSFAHGMTDGAVDLFMQPYKETKEHGAIGLVTGIGKGTAGFTVKSASALLGLVAYPGQGISKSIQAGVRSGTRQSIQKARRIEGEYMLYNSATVKEAESAVIAAFRARKTHGQDQ